VRVDLAYRFRGGEKLSVVAVSLKNRGALVTLKDPVLFDDSPALSLRRLQLHISIGQAF
jgi:hypothetical protein